MVRTNTAVLPGADAAVVRVKETRRAIAMCLDGNGKFCRVNPREGAKLIVAEARAKRRLRRRETDCRDELFEFRFARTTGSDVEFFRND
jgi:hypothetical protein